MFVSLGGGMQRLPVLYEVSSFVWRHLILALRAALRRKLSHRKCQDICIQ